MRPILAVLLLAAAPAFAAQEPPAANLYSQQQSRSIAVQNWSSKAVTTAQVQTTDGKTWNLAKGSIQVDQAKEVIVPAQDCITNIQVKFADGRSLNKAGLHECHNTQIVIRDDGLTIPQQAVPGGQQHATPG